MDRKDYNESINRNTLDCWGIILTILSISYFVEVVRGLRTIPYFIIFMTLIIVPFLIAYIHYIKAKDDIRFKYLFVLGYMILYTFVLLTTKTYVTYVYVIPMVSILLAYCDQRLTLGMFIYVILLNIVSVIQQYISFVDKGSEITFMLKDRITMWEIQLALVTLSGIFLYKTCKIIRQRDEILDTLSEDVCKDALTGTYNKKFLEEKVKYKFQNEETKSIAFIDIDDFKNFNTLFGHSFGDEVLITICNLIEKEISKYKNTYLIRVGGDEFIIFSLDFKNKEFNSFLKQIVKKVDNKKIPFGNKNVGVKISVGMASTDVDDSKNFDDLYDLADSRNGKAKKNGKNYVESR